MPIAMRTASMTPSLLAFVREGCAMMEWAEHELTPARGFHACIDYPQLQAHRYYEGYFHALASTSGCVDSLNPRYGTPMAKPAAPLRCVVALPC